MLLQGFVVSIFDPENQDWRCPPLPSADDVLFQAADDWWNNACLHFGPDGWLTYALGYREGADRLVAQLVDERRHQDLLVYPIVSLYRQYLELAIKGLIRQAQVLIGELVEIPQHHRIDHLWAQCSSLLQRLSPGDSIDEQEQISRLIGEFCAADPWATAFRYPVDKKGNTSLSELRHINVRNVRDVIGKIAVILDGASAQLDHYASCMDDSASDSF